MLSRFPISFDRNILSPAVSSVAHVVFFSAEHRCSVTCPPPHAVHSMVLANGAPLGAPLLTMPSKHDFTSLSKTFVGGSFKLTEL